MIPSAPELEQTVLGAILLEGIDERINFLQPDHFVYKGNSEIFRAIKELEKKKECADIVTVSQLLRKKNKLETVGGAYYISTLSNRIASSANIEYHARILVQEYLKRSALEVGQKIETAVGNKDDAFELIAAAQTNLTNLIENNIQRTTTGLDEVFKESIEHDEKVTEQFNSGQTTGISSGFRGIDQRTGGWQKTDLIILAARPSMGKTALMIAFAMNAAKQGYSVGMFSVEMSALQVAQRMKSIHYHLQLRKFFQGGLLDDEIKMMKDAPLDLPIFVDDTGGLHINQFRNRARVMVRKEGVKLIFVDYLQLMKGDKRQREQEITEISGTLKEIAKELKVPVIALCQLSRAVEQETHKIPKLSHLRESGSIEQDADIVMFLYRPEYYGILEDGNNESTEGAAKLMIAKNRNGALANGDFGIRIHFDKEYTRFKDYDQTTPDSIPF